MSYLDAIIFGIAQGLTEFIPVSSSGHIIVMQHLRGSGADHLFLEFINLGTLAALLIYFRVRIISIIRDCVVNKNFVLMRNIILTSIPAGLIGLVFSGFIAKEPFFASLGTVAVTFLVVGIIMVILEKLPKAMAKQEGGNLPWWQAFIVGLAQMLALTPGVSRSGSTIIAGRLMGLTPAAAAEYSFLASLPIMIAVAAKNFLKSSDRAYFLDHFSYLLVGNIAAFVAGILAISYLMNYLQKHGLSVFGWYRIGLSGIIVIVLLLQ